MFGGGTKIVSQFFMKKNYPKIAKFINLNSSIFNLPEKRKPAVGNDFLLYKNNFYF